eukprot:scaffold16998_cov66-Skeletonema_marinoi.AAC.1
MRVSCFNDGVDDNSQNIIPKLGLAATIELLALARQHYSRSVAMIMNSQEVAREKMRESNSNIKDKNSSAILLLATILATVGAYCPNACSGHGSCGIN